MKLESKRWLIAAAAVVMQVCLGTVYAWSVFKKPLMGVHGWEEFPTQATFMILMAVLATSAAFGGILVDKKGPRFVATIGGVLFGLGTIGAGFAAQTGSLPLLYLTFGVLAGLGNGFGYVTPIATLIRWFPDKRGLVTGLAVMGFGFGAFFMGRYAPMMINAWDVKDAAGTVTQSGAAMTWYVWGAIFLVLVTGAAQLFSNPPKGWVPEGFVPQAGKASSAAESYSLPEAIRTPGWWMLWTMLCLNVAAGLGLLSQLSPMAQGVMSTADPTLDKAALALAAGNIVAISSIFNGLGRLFWASVSDKIGRRNVFLTMFATQALLYVFLPSVANTVLFTVVACYLLACYGGGFATMPAFAADAFGPAYIGRVYGTMLTAWGVAGIVGPLVFAQLKGASALYAAAGLLVVGGIITAVYRKPAPKVAPAA